MLRSIVVLSENSHGNVYVFIKLIASGTFVMTGDGRNKKSMGCVGNISAFLVSLVSTKEGVEIYNFAGKADLSLKEIVEIIKNELNIQRKVIFISYSIGLAGGYVFDLFSLITSKKIAVCFIRIKEFTAETTITTNKLLESDFKELFSSEES